MGPFTSNRHTSWVAKTRGQDALYQNWIRPDRRSRVLQKMERARETSQEKIPILSPLSSHDRNGTISTDADRARG